MVTRFPLRLASSVTDGKVSMACMGVSRVLCCRFGVTSSNSCRPFVSIGRHFTDPHEASSGNLSWEHGSLNNQLTKLLLATLHIFTCLN